jgi:hypothetical protein
MKKIISFCFLFACAATAFAQKETFDLVTYTAPKGWKKQPGESAVQFIKEDSIKNIYGLLTLYKSIPSTANAKDNFDMAWASLVKEMVTVSAAPEMLPTATEDGWQIHTGYAAFESDGNKGVVLLVTSSGFDKMVNVIILTNTDAYEQTIAGFLESMVIKKPTQASQPGGTTNTVNAAIIGTWGVSSTSASYYNMGINEGTIITQYTFNTNGTYSFYIKIFRYQLDKLLLTRETGIYQISGNNITISPQKSVAESWSRKNGTDKWGVLISSQKKELEKTTYRFSVKDFGSGPLLILESGQVTKRDGPFNNSEKNAWFYPSKSGLELLELPGGKQPTSQGTQVEQINQTSTKNNPVIIGKARADGFAFNTSNFDDGWTSTAQEDWVMATKGNTRVLIHYPNKNVESYSTDLLERLKNAWNVLVAPRYSSATNFEFKPIRYFESVEFAEADVIEKATGKPVHVVLFKKNFSGGAARYLEFITPTKSVFEKEFVAYHNDPDGWDKMTIMVTYNKFAVAASDLRGKWTNKFTGVTQYVNAVTGLDAGMTSHASVENFQLGPGNDYKWEVTVASGVVGNLKFQNAKSSGKFSMSGNWKVNFSDIEGKPRAFNAYFSCIKGLRILWLDDTAFAKVE